jgi:hypothetical protein
MSDAENLMTYIIINAWNQKSVGLISRRCGAISILACGLVSVYILSFVTL